MRSLGIWRSLKQSSALDLTLCPKTQPLDPTTDPKVMPTVDTYRTLPTKLRLFYAELWKRYRCPPSPPSPPPISLIPLFCIMLFSLLTPTHRIAILLMDFSQIRLCAENRRRHLREHRPPSQRTRF
jgi:hypothetical protein